MKTLKCFILIFIIFQGLSYPQDTNIVKYFPLQVGDKWIYDRSQPPYYPPGPGKDLSKIESTFVADNHRYFMLQNFVYTSSGIIYMIETSSYRVDSLSGIIYKKTSQGECLLDSLKSKKGDSALSCVGWGQPTWFRCTDTNTYPIFGQSPKSKVFTWSDYFESGMTRTYAKDFGIVYKEEGAVMAWKHYFLKGCVLNGVVYGDTTLTGLIINTTITPVNYYLFQNYPNPFNPNSNIKFQIAKSGSVRLVVFDILGGEISTLVNEHLGPGTYEVEWDGTNYPSGVYFYKLTAGDYTETRKMVLIK